MTRLQPSDMHRNSSIELLRLILMLFILIIHALGICWDFPMGKDYLLHSSLVTSKVVLNHFCLVAVNVFVLISGYFGIRSSIKGFADLCFKCLFFQLVIGLVFFLTGRAGISWTNLLNTIVPGSGYWFIVCYMVMYILSPVLNTFSYYAEKRYFKIILVSYFLFQTIYGFGCWQGGFGAGYSVLSFIGLYLLGRFLKLQEFYGSISKTRLLGGYFGSVCISIIFSMILVRYGDGNVLASYGQDSVGYIQPFVIISSICFLGVFEKMSFHNKVINTLSRSSLAIYLFHCNPLVLPIYRSFFSFGEMDLMPIVRAIWVILFFAIIALVLDCPRLFLWKSLFCKLFDK